VDKDMPALGLLLHGLQRADSGPAARYAMFAHVCGLTNSLTISLTVSTRVPVEAFVW